MASQSAAAHIMKPVVSMSMSPESFCSGERGAGVAAEATTGRTLTCGPLGGGWSGMAWPFRFLVLLHLPDRLWHIRCRGALCGGAHKTLEFPHSRNAFEAPPCPWQTATA